MKLQEHLGCEESSWKEEISREKVSYASFVGGSEVKVSASNAGDPGLIPGLGRPLEKDMATHSNIPSWKSHGQRSLAGYSPRGCKESDTNEHTHC